MDTLLTALNSFAVNPTPNDPAAPHPRFAQYKQPSRTPCDQDERRRRLLQEQKKRRFDYLQHARRLADDDFSEPAQDAAEKPEKMDTAEAASKSKHRFSNQLMLSEWLVEVPETLEQDWLFVMCPIGKRSLVVASNGTTRAYAKSGYRICSFPSLLPGGCKSSGNGVSFTLIDCIWNELTRSFYVLDIMCWRGHPVFDCDTDFRFYWLRTKLTELPQISQKSRLNPYPFQAVPYTPCTRECISSALNPSEDSHMFGDERVELDGLLFYHKGTHYTIGPTPLVGWLKAGMVPDVLGVSVAPVFMKAAPPKAAKSKRKKGKDEKMDCVDEPQASV